MTFPSSPPLAPPRKLELPRKGRHVAFLVRVPDDFEPAHCAEVPEQFDDLELLASGRWITALARYHKWDMDMFCCPNATKEWYDEFGTDLGVQGTYLGSTTAWGYYTQDNWPVAVKGSYGINGYCNNPTVGPPHGRPSSEQWRGPDVRGAAYVPLFLDALRYNGWPLDTDVPPTTDNVNWSSSDQNQMGRYCVNRHDGFSTVLFLDFSARRVGLKELWTLKWHKSYNVTNERTITGGMMPEEWPKWLRGFKDY